MKMNLKNYKKIDFKIFNKKNYYIFLISFFVVSTFIGILFYLYLNSSDKKSITDNITSYFTINSSYNYKEILFENFKSNFSFLLIFWILGISIIGSFINLFLYFSEGFSLGFSICAIIKTFKIKGLIANFCYLIPSKLLFIISLFILTYFSIKFSYKLILCLFFKKDINFKEEMRKYLKIFIISSILLLIVSLLETFVNPIMIKIFTKL